MELARRGCAVTGVDLSEASLALAAARAAEAGVEVRFERADMRRIGFEAEFDAVINMFTAFGYFEDADNRLVLERIAAALVPGGGFLMEFGNPVSVFARFEARGWHALSDGTVMLEERAYDARPGPVRDVLDVRSRRRAARAALLAPGVHGAGAGGDGGRRRGSAWSTCGAAWTGPS